MKLCDGDEDNSLLSMTPSQDGIPPPDPLRVDWPKVTYVQFTKCKSNVKHFSWRNKLRVYFLVVND